MTAAFAATNAPLACACLALDRDCSRSYWTNVRLNTFPSREQFVCALDVSFHDARELTHDSRRAHGQHLPVGVRKGQPVEKVLEFPTVFDVDDRVPVQRSERGTWNAG